MPDILTISTQTPANPAFDYEALRNIGIQHIEKTASAIWTDYNVHDPGITTLELLCYAITELSYRTTYSVPDLLATETDTAKNIQKHFFSAAQILPVKAVTINDYRKLLIDIEGVKNAWLKKNTKKIFADLINKKLLHEQPTGNKWEAVNVKGYYDTLLEFDTNIKDADKPAIKKKAMEALMASRNLCEDFLSIEEVAKQDFRLCCEIEVTSSTNAFDMLAQLFFNIQMHLTPFVKFYWLKELFEQNQTADKIFEGPLLQHGFIKNSELEDSELKTEIHLSDIMQQMLRVDGVINILDIIFNSTGQVDELPNKWIIDVEDGKQPIVNILESNILLYKEGMPFRPDLNIVKAKFEALMSAYIAGNDLVRSEDISYDTGSYQNTGSYFSIQNHYPKTYGISHWGLADDSTPERKVQAKQLQGYLFFFDQQLANFLAQLSHVKNLFSLDDEKKTFFTQLVNDFKDAKNLFVTPASIETNISTAAETADVFNNRRNLFLDHLLSRFSESFFDYVNILQTIFPYTNSKEIIDTKIGFLKNYPQYSSERFSAYNYTNGTQLWDTDNVSGLEKRVGRLLGFKNIQRHVLVNIFFIIQTDGTQFWFEIIDNRTGKILLTAFDKFSTREEAEDELEVALLLAYNISSYLVVKDPAEPSKFIFQLVDKMDKVIAVSGIKYNSKANADSAISDLVSLLTTRQSEEGMYLVEHLLLLPEEKEPAGDSGFMPICVNENCDDCGDRDPYSFRISVVLPAYAPRFLNMDFRRYCERHIRMETPSHLFPRICWVSNEQLQEFEKAYKDWLEVKAGSKEDADNKILNRFVKILTALRTIYPPARLEDCSNKEERKLFILNQNALGTLKS